jgi:CRISPR/Cas system-associated protein Csm6
MSRGTQIALSLILCALVLGGVLAGARLWNVHQATSDWVLLPKEVPSKVQVFTVEPSGKNTLT